MKPIVAEHVILTRIAEFIGSAFQLAEFQHSNFHQLSLMLILLEGYIFFVKINLISMRTIGFHSLVENVLDTVKKKKIKIQNRSDSSKLHGIDFCNFFNIS